MTTAPTQDYEAFLREKVNFSRVFGFDCGLDEISPVLKPHQRLCVQWAVRGGRRALFEAFGLGKSLQQLEILRLTLLKSGGTRGLIVAPLGVRQEFCHDATELLGIPAPMFIRTSDQLQGAGIYLTNYESVRDGKLDPGLFDAVSLDESGILRSFGSKTYQTFLTLFDQVPYRFVATATPSPNRYKELIHYAAFLGIMDSAAALTRWFQRDSTKANNLTLYSHKQDEFWTWVSTWSVWLQSPADLGCDATGYVLPEMLTSYHEVPSIHSCDAVDRDGQQYLFQRGVLGVREGAREKRETLPARVVEAIRLVAGYLTADPGDQVIVWVTLNSEQDAVEQALAARGVSFSSVHGSLSTEECEQHILDWRARRTSVLIGKPVMLGQGLNLQQCNKAVFVGVDYRFSDLIQACHRIQRFGQTRTCHVHIIHADSEREVLRTLREKWARHEELTTTMTGLIRKHGLSLGAVDDLARTIGVARAESVGEGWVAVNNDCVLETRDMVADSVDLIVTSIPFSNHYEYTSCYDDKTELLTRRGWLSFEHLTMGDECATVNPVTFELEWQHPEALVWQHYDGPMLHFTQRNSFDLLVTPDHKIFVDRRVGNRATGRKERQFELVRAEDVARSHAHRKWVMAATVKPSKGAWPATVRIPQVNRRASHRNDITQIATPDFMELAGWYLSEGCVGAAPVQVVCDRCGALAKPDARWCSPYCRARAAVDRRRGWGSAEYLQRIALRPRQRTSGSCGRICISQYREVHPEHWRQIQDMWRRIGLPTRVTNRCIEVWDISLATFLRDEFGSAAHNKRIPRWVKDLDSELLRILRDTMMKGDGSERGYAYTSVSDQLRDDFQEICLATGWRSEIVRHGTGAGRAVNIGTTNLFPEIRDTPRRIAYSGMIGCATVPNHTLIVRRNGCAVVSGNSYHDFGHTDNNEHFWAQMDYLTPELLRVLRPGRLLCCHVKDRILFGSVTGAGVPTVSPFHAEGMLHGIRHGFDYLGMITVVTDVVRENNQTYRLGWSENSKDSTKMGVGSPEYVLLFRKPQTDRSRAYADIPVTKDKAVYTRARWQTDAHSFWRSSGDRYLAPAELAQLPSDQMSAVFTDQSLRQVYDYEAHVATGELLEERGQLPATFMSLAPGSHHPQVWHDINRMDTLNTEQSRRAQTMHVCPIQRDLVKRLIVRYSNPGELVADPFAGIMTVPLVAIQNGRRGLGIELNPDYFRDGVAYLRAQEHKEAAPTLFDVLTNEVVA
jgi:hypothetical protein